jgi:hypothetical protein
MFIMYRTDLHNEMADGMMTLQQECEAFGETMPEPKTNNHGQKHQADG